MWLVIGLPIRCKRQLIQELSRLKLPKNLQKNLTTHKLSMSIYRNQFPQGYLSQDLRLSIRLVEEIQLVEDSSEEVWVE